MKHSLSLVVRHACDYARRIINAVTIGATNTWLHLKRMTTCANLLIKLVTYATIYIVKVFVSKSNIPDRSVCIQESVVNDACSAGLRHLSSIFLTKGLLSRIVELAALQEFIELLHFNNEGIIFDGALLSILSLLVLRIRRNWSRVQVRVKSGSLLIPELGRG